MRKVRKITLITPLGKEIACLEVHHVREYLAGKGLTLLRTVIPFECVAVPTEVGQEVRRGVSANESKRFSIRPLSTKEEIRDQILDYLDREGEVLVFAPLLTMRHYYNLTGFVGFVEEVLASLVSVDVVLPPGLYGRHYMFALRSGMPSSSLSARQANAP